MAAQRFKLQMLVEESPAEILSKISFNAFEFKSLLESPELTTEETKLAVKTLNRMCEVSADIDTVLKCLNLILTAESFFQKVVQVVDIYSHDPTPAIVLNTLMLVKNFLQKLPSQSLMPLIPIISMAQEFIFKLERDGDQSGLLQDIQTEFQSIEEIKKEVIETMRKVKRIASGHRGEVPPEDFRTLSVIPTPRDVKSRARPFIRKNVIKGQYKDVDDYLDIQFRLLREDLVAPFRNGVQLLMKKKDRREKIQRQDLQDISVYEGVRLLEPVATSKGVMLRVYFRVSDFKRVNWENSKRLIFGSLLCLSSDNFKTMLFCSVADRNPADIRNGIFFVKMEGDIPSLNFDPDEIYTMVETSSYFEAYRYNLEGLQKTNAATLPMKKYLLGIETKEVEHPAYLTHDSQYIIQKKRVKVLDLKTWPKEQDTPFEKAQYKALQSALTKEFAVIQGPPGTGKTFLGLEILKVLLHEDNKHCWKQNQKTRMREPGRQILIVCYTNHALDQFVEGIIRFQKEGVLRIGGGSKTENIKLRNCYIQNYKRRTGRGRRDQEEIDLRDEIGHLQTKFNSKLEKLILDKNSILNEKALQSIIAPQHYNSLITRRRRKGCGAMEQWLIFDGQERLAPQNQMLANQGEHEENENELDAEMFADAMSNDRLIYGMDDNSEASKTYKKVYKQAFELDDEEEARKLIIVHKEELQNRESKWIRSHRITNERCKILKKRINETKKMNQWEVLEIQNVWRLNTDDRWRLYRYWLHVFCSQESQLTDIEEEYRTKISELNELHREKDVEAMEMADIIAMTTTGAAKYLKVLRKLKPAIVIVEEAAEVLEAHIVTSLSEGCKHLILIGDHKQLKPKPTVYRLARHYHLDVSLFERMIKNGMHCDTLNIQHRMREEICALLVPYIYTDLTNHESVYKYPDVMGITRNMFFFNHEHLEDNKGEGTSHSNLFEARFIVKLAYYFMLQGYTADRITILTTYLQQMFTVQQVVGQTFPKEHPKYGHLKIKPVDNYQGEENDIVLLSLVRSNEENKVGFLNVSNRVCVALSRAKIGFYVVGNMAQLEAASPLWKKIINDLKSKGSVVDALPLACQNHPENKIDAKNPEDFAKAPEGGCMKSCDFRLSCGHVCERKCHPTDPKHEQTVCKKTCQRKCDLGHVCPKLCDEDCGKCLEMVVDREWPCGHVLTTYCYRRPDNFGCYEIVEKELPCQHKHNMQCFQEVETYPCNEITALKLVCDHVVSMKCCLARQYNRHKKIRFCMGECKKNIDVKDKNHYILADRNSMEACFNKGEIEGFLCQEFIFVTLPCGHKMQEKCSNVDKYTTFQQSVNCTAMVDLELNCGHNIKAKCNAANCYKVADYNTFMKSLDNEKNYYPCQEVVKVSLPCGHQITERCHITQMNDFKQLAKCNEIIHLKLECGHWRETMCWLGYSCVQENERVELESNNKETSPDNLQIIVFLVVQPSGHCLSTYFKSSSEYSAFAETLWNVPTMLQKELDKRCQDRELGKECPFKDKNLIHLHIVESEVECFKKNMSHKCKEKIDFTLSCNHVKTLECHQIKENIMTNDFQNISGKLKVDQNIQLTEEYLDEEECINIKLRSLAKDSITFCQTLVEMPLYCKHRGTSVSCGEAQMYQLITNALQEEKTHLPLLGAQFKDHLGAQAFKCKERETNTLACGHQQTLTCSEHLVHKVLRQFSEATDDKCNKLVTLHCPSGNKSHIWQVNCHQNTTVGKCPFSCGGVLICGHKCGGKCGDCFYSGEHLPCRRPCERQLLCRHLCDKRCLHLCPLVCQFCHTVPRFKALAQDIQKIEEIHNRVNGISPDVLVPCQKLRQFSNLKIEFEKPLDVFHIVVIALVHIQDICLQLYKNGKMNFKTNLKISDKILSEKMTLATESLQKLDKENWRKHVRPCIHVWVQLYSILQNIVKLKGMLVWSENVCQSSQKNKTTIYQEEIGKEIQHVLQYDEEDSHHILDQLEFNPEVLKPVNILRLLSKPVKRRSLCIGVSLGGTRWFKCNEGHLFPDLENKDENLLACRVCGPKLGTEKTEVTITWKTSEELFRKEPLQETDSQRNSSHYVYRKDDTIHSQHVNAASKKRRIRRRKKKNAKDSTQQKSMEDEMKKIPSQNIKHQSACEMESSTQSPDASSKQCYNSSPLEGGRPKEYIVIDNCQLTHESDKHFPKLHKEQHKESNNVKGKSKRATDTPPKEKSGQGSKENTFGSWGNKYERRWEERPGEGTPQDNREGIIRGAEGEFSARGQRYGNGLRGGDEGCEGREDQGVGFRAGRGRGNEGLEVWDSHGRGLRGGRGRGNEGFEGWENQGGGFRGGMGRGNEGLEMWDSHGRGFRGGRGRGNERFEGWNSQSRGLRGGRVRGKRGRRGNVSN